MSQNVLLSPLRWCWLMVGVLAMGCGEEKKPIVGKSASEKQVAGRESPSARSPALVVEQPGNPELELVDPPPPAGDLAAEIEAFTDLKSCALRHRLGDPIVADAVEALGYDRLATDACRGIEALKRRDGGPCREVLSSALRRHCEAQVAMYTGQPELCPLTGRVLGVAEREPLCLAAARRDVRPCAALVGM
ncbi:MAG: hypothetical protein RMJ98_18630, partial [Myxococcales bacterium]|nr:hypothetical protein [Polyangiaceae bacterium]MDW8251316.1 hypothetical protein [Myxococcales bacterium]